jgi:L-lactate dehydrogenase complex protein LldG
MTTRSEFLDRVRAGLGRGPRSISAPPGVDDQLIRLTRPSEDLVGLFASRAGAAGMAVHSCTLDELAATVGSLVAPLDPRCVVLDSLDPLLARPVTDALAGLGARVIDPRTTRALDPQFDAAAGITGVHAAIAETGTLVLASDAERSRGTFIIPPVHIALVLESQIIPDMIDLWPRIGPRPPTAVTLVSGPSKTADIEGILVTGVHGPGAVHVVLVADSPAATPRSQGERP